MTDWGSLVAATALGGLGATWLQRHWAVGTQRRIRRDMEREAALHALVDQCVDLEAQVDFMLSPERLHGDGVFETMTMYSADSCVKAVEVAWRLQAAPFLPGADGLVRDVQSALFATQEALDGQNPPIQAFFDRVRDLGATGSALREAAQEEIVHPRDAPRWRRWLRLS